MADRKRKPINELLTLGEVVAELLDGFTAADDWPADHRCVKSLGYDPALGYDSARHACSHAAFASRPLLDRLMELVMPGTAPAKEDPGKRPKGSRHSPAPWDRKAGELVDEILRGSLDLDTRLRRVLRFTPLTITYRVRPAGWHPPLAWPGYERLAVPAVKVPLEDAGPAALRDIVRILPLLRDRDAGHHLADHEPVPGDHIPSWEQPPEPAIRAWHQAALLITGHERPWPRVTQVPNPDHPDHCRRGEYLLGPVHAGCSHESCRLMRSARHNRWVQARCPHCGSASLRQNPITQSVECQRPRCTDERGRRHIWTIVELRALGMAIEERVSA